MIGGQVARMLANFAPQLMIRISHDANELPLVGDHARAHMQQMLDSIRQLVDDHGGWIGFDEYMDHVLYAPGFGYYRSGSHKLGEHGDFMTAAEISPLFGRTLAAYLGEHLPAGGSLLELGAGSGRMARDILLELDMRQQLPASYEILELSSELRERQQHLLADEIPGLMQRINWRDSLRQDRAFTGIIFGNEVVDAMPVKRFTIADARVYELGVGWADNEPVWRMAEYDESFHQEIAALLPEPVGVYPSGYRSEMNPALGAWLQTCYEFLGEGMLLLLDYGMGREEYYRPDRTDGTLRAYHQHHAVDDPFYRPGLTDITAWVDFSQLCGLACDAGFELDIFTTQARFLVDSGILELADPSAEGQDLLLQAQAIRKLTLPSEMGDTVKVVALSRDGSTRRRHSGDLRYQL